MNPLFPDLLTAILALLLVVAAVVDIRTFTISNRLVIAVALLAPLFWLAASIPLWPDAGYRVAIAAAVFAGLAATFYLGMMGGGDVKLAAALALWFSPLTTVKFLVLMSIAGGALTLIVIVAHKIRSREGRPEIPYGVAIAFGGLWLVAQRFLNHFA
ncbi:prepilin peptidase [Sphingomonas sp.]|uniref:A24 family peptidase n=1 Tax=Sphingomonas sp. TaxID=28214 RepID=UPI00286B5C61|nr:prepilin peptidase [Sphingomonas sp.]